MRRKILQHYADMVCHMFVGWRMSPDLETLSDLPSGIIDVDLLRGNAIHDKVGKIDLYVSKEIQAWLFKQLKDEKIEIDHIELARLSVEMDTDKIATDKKRVVCFNWKCSSQIKTDEKTYSGSLVEEHKWHKRIK